MSFNAIHENKILQEISGFTVINASLWENMTLLYAKNKGTAQPMQPRSLFSAFVNPSLDRTIAQLVTSRMTRLCLVSLAKQVKIVMCLDPHLN